MYVKRKVNTFTISSFESLHPLHSLVIHSDISIYFVFDSKTITDIKFII